MMDERPKAELGRAFSMLNRAEGRLAALLRLMGMPHNPDLNDPIHRKKRLQTPVDLRDGVDGCLLAYDRWLSLAEEARRNHGPLDPVDFYPCLGDHTGYAFPSPPRSEAWAYTLERWTDNCLDDDAIDRGYEVLDWLLEQRDRLDGLQARCDRLNEWAERLRVSQLSTCPPGCDHRYNRQCVLSCYENDAPEP